MSTKNFFERDEGMVQHSLFAADVLTAPPDPEAGIEHQASRLKSPCTPNRLLLPSIMRTAIPTPLFVLCAILLVTGCASHAQQKTTHSPRLSPATSKNSSF